MIRKLRFKFIVMSMITVLVLLAVILAITYYMNYRTALSEADDILSLIPRVSTVSDNTGETLLLPYESRFFSVTVNEDGTISDDRIEMPDSFELSQDQAREYALQVLSGGVKEGVTGEYRYVLHNDQDNTLIEFINIGQQLESLNIFFKTSLLITAACYILFFIVLLFFSGKFIKPVASSYEKQKQFITNAGHGLKTPLTIIDADVEVLKMDLEENEWLDDIQKQTAQLTSLTNDLVYLSKLDEANGFLKKIEFPFSEMLAETAESFRLAAEASGRTFLSDIDSTMTYTGDEKSIHQLLSILLDNALKYSAPAGRIRLSAQKHGKAITLSISNTTEAYIPKEETEHIFERFYRINSSINSEISGHGIGLSVAKAIVESHGGHIQAVTDKEPSFTILVTL